MKAIIPSLYIGSEIDYEKIVKYEQGWFTIHACKEPYHRRALGYTGRAASKEHPEYLFAYRDSCLILNLVDVDNPEYIRKEIIDEAIKTIDFNLKNGHKVLVHCNQGQSRSGVIGLLYLHAVGVITTDCFEEAENQYLELYPWYEPANGMRMFAKNYWNNYKYDYSCPSSPSKKTT